MPACRQLRHNEINARRMERVDARETKNAKQRANYHNDLATQRDKSRLKAAEFRKRNPGAPKVYRAKQLVKVQQARQQRMWLCQRCGLAEPQGKRDSRTRYCQMCKPIVVHENKIKSAARQKLLVFAT
jgi:hypothetical protein